MTPKRQRTQSDPVERFVDAAKSWRDAMARDDSRTANKHHDRSLVPILRETIGAGPALIQRFVEWVDHEDEAVALWAACFALRYDSARAERVLQRLAQHPSLYIGFDAQMTLGEWKRGTLEPAAWEQA